MTAPTYPLNWVAGWLLILLAFITGAAIGLFFHREDFLGGYQSFRRRLLRLGHIALAALGMMNVIFSLSPWPAPAHWTGGLASLCFLVGGLAMPAACFLTSWRSGFRHVFAVPVAALFFAVIFTLTGGLR